MLKRNFSLTRYLSFALVGLSGVLVHLTFLTIGLKLIKFTFMPSQLLATFIAMTSNFYLNNIFTYNLRKLKGPVLFKGLLSFYVACSIGAMINVCIATLFFKGGIIWWLAGLAGITAGSIFNFTITAIFTWPSNKQN